MVEQSKTSSSLTKNDEEDKTPINTRGAQYFLRAFEKRGEDYFKEALKSFCMATGVRTDLHDVLGVMYKTSAGEHDAGWPYRRAEMDGYNKAIRDLQRIIKVDIVK